MWKVTENNNAIFDEKISEENNLKKLSAMDDLILFLIHCRTLKIESSFE